jgi:hypothetical protein
VSTEEPWTPQTPTEPHPRLQLKSLKLAHNLITGDGALALAIALQDCTTLLSLDLTKLSTLAVAPFQDAEVEGESERLAARMLHLPDSEERRHQLHTLRSKERELAALRLALHRERLREVELALASISNSLEWHANLQLQQERDGREWSSRQLQVCVCVSVCLCMCEYVYDCVCVCGGAFLL